MNKDVSWRNALQSLGGEYDRFKDLEDLEMSHFELNEYMNYGDEDSDDDGVFEEDEVF